MIKTDRCFENGRNIKNMIILLCVFLMQLQIVSNSQASNIYISIKLEKYL